MLEAEMRAFAWRSVGGEAIIEWCSLCAQQSVLDPTVPRNTAKTRMNLIREDRVGLVEAGGSSRVFSELRMKFSTSLEGLGIATREESP